MPTFLQKEFDKKKNQLDAHTPLGQNNLKKGDRREGNVKEERLTRTK